MGVSATPNPSTNGGHVMSPAQVVAKHDLYGARGVPWILLLIVALYHVAKRLLRAIVTDFSVEIDAVC
jgi:hypothetical protein